MQKMKFGFDTVPKDLEPAFIADLHRGGMDPDCYQGWLILFLPNGAKGLCKVKRSQTRYISFERSGYLRGAKKKYKRYTQSRRVDHTLPSLMRLWLIPILPSNACATCLSSPYLVHADAIPPDLVCGYGESTSA